MVISRLGEVFFRFRSFTPVPLYIFLFITGTYDTIPFITGTLLIVIGESLRIMAVGYIGKESRVSGVTAPILITSGPYAHMRNPIYTGNILIYLGFTALSNSFLILAIPCVFIFFGMIYYCIVIYEETYLRKKFGTDYELYSQLTPRLIPKYRTIYEDIHHPKFRFDIYTAIKSEQPTFVALAVCYNLLVLKFFLF
ncbi:isoprenylcysteine carboxylmethyltransferase family protein [bacterium]|nr:isoprenylcysteine carboxylmethyltransferase family protein [bacterium]